jgi:hypothetical protein
LQVFDQINCEQFCAKSFIAFIEAFFPMATGIGEGLLIFAAVLFSPPIEKIEGD